MENMPIKETSSGALRKANFSPKLILGVVASVLVMGISLAIYLFFENSLRPSTLTDESVVRGEVVNLDVSRVQFDAPMVIRIRDENGKILIVSASPELYSGCDAIQGVYREKISVGSRVEIFANFKDGEGFICDSPNYYIKRLPSDNIDISRWETYRNEQYGFEMRYPIGWQVAINGDGILLESVKTKSSLWISQNKNPGNLPLDDWFQEATVVGGRPTVKAVAKAIMVNGVRAYRVNSNLAPPNPYFEIVGIADKYRNIFYIFATYNSVEDAYFLEKIVSTFQFVDKGINPTWQTYRNEEFGFEIKYPSNWWNRTSLEYNNDSANKEKIYEFSSDKDGSFTNGNIRLQILASQNANKIALLRKLKGLKEGERLEGGNAQNSYIKIGDITLGGVFGVKFKTELMAGLGMGAALPIENEILLRKEDRVYHFVVIMVGDLASENSQRNQKTLDQILSTFRFAGKVEGGGK